MGFDRSSGESTDDPRITVAEISLNGADPIDVFNVLLLNANQVLAEGGERDFSTALAEAQERANEFREEPLPPGFVEAAALKCWQEGNRKSAWLFVATGNGRDVLDYCRSVT